MYGDAFFTDYNEIEQGDLGTGSHTGQSSATGYPLDDPAARSEGADRRARPLTPLAVEFYADKVGVIFRPNSHRIVPRPVEEGWEGGLAVAAGSPAG